MNTCVYLDLDGIRCGVQCQGGFCDTHAPFTCLCCDGPAMMDDTAIPGTDLVDRVCETEYKRRRK